MFAYRLSGQEFFGGDRTVCGKVTHLDLEGWRRLSVDLMVLSWLQYDRWRGGTDETAYGVRRHFVMTVWLEGGCLWIKLVGEG